MCSSYFVNFLQIVVIAHDVLLLHIRVVDELIVQIHNFSILLNDSHRIVCGEDASDSFLNWELCRSELAVHSGIKNGSCISGENETICRYVKVYDFLIFVVAVDHLRQDFKLVIVND